MPSKSKTILFLVILAAVILALFGIQKRNNSETASAVDIKIPQSYQDALIIDNGNDSLSISPLDTAQSQVVQTGNQYVYHDAYPNTDVVQTKDEYRIKEELQFRQSDHPTQFKYRITNPDNYHIEKDGNGNFVFYNKNIFNQYGGSDDLGRLFTLPAPFVQDAKGQHSTEAVKTLIENGLLTITIDKNWLDKAVYPVILDPTIEINILNVHSHPLQGQNWEVDFTTQGQADLKIIPNDQNTIKDDDFVSLWCGSEERTPQILSNDVIYYPNWSCDDVGKVIHHTQKAGNHTLRFEFGGLTVFAYNSAPIALLNHTFKNGTVNNNGYDRLGNTTDAIDTTGATLLIVSAISVGCPSDTVYTVTDNKGNTWHPLTKNYASYYGQEQMFYAWDHGGSPLVVGAGHTFHTETIDCGSYGFVYVSAYSGTDISQDPFDSENSNSANNGVYAGSVTPSVNGSLIVTSIASHWSPVPYTIDCGFAIIDEIDTNNGTPGYLGSAHAYLIQTTAATIDPFWDGGESYELASVIAVFKPATEGAPTRTAPSVALASQGTSTLGYYSSAYAYRRPLIINHNKVSTVSGTTLSNFPVLVNVTSPDLKASVSGGNVQRSNGNDILFTDSTGLTKLSYELESFNGTTGNVVAWVKVASLTPTADVTIFMYYDNATATDQSDKANVWDASYKGVWHLPNGTTLASPTLDSTGVAGNGTLSGATPPSATSGKMDGAASFDGNTSYVGVNYDLARSDSTASFWLKTTGSDRGILQWSADSYLYTNYTDRVFYVNSSGAIKLYVYGGGSCSGSSNFIDGTTTVNDNNWHYVVGTWNGSGKNLYVDGQLQASNATGISAASAMPYMAIGYGYAGTCYNPSSGYFPGTLDEVRMSTIMRSADWIKTEYNNQNDPGSFVGMGAAQSSARTAPFLNVRGGVKFH